MEYYHFFLLTKRERERERERERGMIRDKVGIENTEIRVIN